MLRKIKNDTRKNEQCSIEEKSQEDGLRQILKEEFALHSLEVSRSS